MRVRAGARGDLCIENQAANREHAIEMERRASACRRFRHVPQGQSLCSAIDQRPRHEVISSF